MAEVAGFLVDSEFFDGERDERRPERQECREDRSGNCRSLANFYPTRKIDFFSKKGTYGENVGFLQFFEGTYGSTTDEVEGTTGELHEKQEPWP